MMKKNGSLLRTQMPASTKWILACFGVWVVLAYLFGCASSLQFLHPVMALFELTPLYALELLVASIGFLSIVKWFAEKKNGDTTTGHDDKIKRRKLLLRFCTFFFIAFILECTFFQYHHYAYMGANSVISTRDSKDNWSTLRFAQLSLGSDSFFQETYYFSLADVLDGTEKDVDRIEFIQNTLQYPSNNRDEEYEQGLEEYNQRVEEEGIKAATPKYVTYDEDMAVITFSNLNKRISSVHITPFFLPEQNPITGDSTHSIDVVVLYTDDDNTLQQTAIFKIVEGQKYTEYIPVYPIGEATEFSICFSSRGAAFTEITLNEMIPLTPVLLRMLIVSGVLFFLYFLRRFNIFSIRYNPTSRRQKIGIACIVGVLFLYFLIQAVNSISFPYEDGSAGQYNHYLIDALMDGRFNLDLPTSAEYASLNRPYDRNLFTSIYDLDYLGDKLHWDTVYYNGMWYSYFGIVPAIVLFLPYTALTGQYLPYQAACFIFGFVAVVFLLLIWRRLYNKYLSGTACVVYYLSSLVIGICTFVPFLLRRSFFYETVNLAGLMFCAAGLWLLLEYKEKRKKSFLIVSCLCFALSVGCRPILVLMSAYVPVLLWEEFQERWEKNKMGFFRWICIIAIPYILVAIPLMYYNYARFGSVFEFGLSYQVTALNIGVQDQLHPLGKLYRYLTGIKGFLFNPPSLSEAFPFVTVGLVAMSNGVHISQYLGAVGIAWIPVTWLHLGRIHTREIKKEHPILNRFIVSSLIICVVAAALSATYCIQPRYEIDYAWIAILSSLACLVFIYKKYEDKWGSQTVDALVTTLCVLSMIMFVFLNFRGEVFDDGFDRPMAFDYYFRRAFTFFEGI